MSKPVRVRIAPSPTGFPHVGTGYIALFNYAFAASQQGQFVLRIEDTDQTRSDPHFETMILDSLRWLGLQWDEGPDVGGPHGPYRQSERTEHYRKHAQILLDGGHAYHCFCTPERLEALRKDPENQARGGGYDGKCMALSPEEVASRKAAGEAAVVRMKVPSEGSCTVHDMLRGDITFDYRQVDHQVLLKSDGFPTYHLANVVDDHLMGISHVIRGEEWLNSLPKHLILYQAFGWEAPVVIHLPLLRNEDKSKLSKRKNPTSILYYKEMGFLPEAMVNFLGLMAYSLPGGEEIFSLEDMVASFDMQRVSLGGPIFDQQKLRWLNQKHIGQMDGHELLHRLMDWRFNTEYLSKLVPMMQNRMHTLGDFMRFCDFIFLSDVAVDSAELVGKKSEDETRDFLLKMIWELEPLIDFSAEAMEATFTKVAQIHGWNMREATHSVRVAVCGKKVAPPLFEVMALLGSDLVRSRLNAAVTQLGALGKKKLDKLQKAYQKASAAYVAPSPEAG